MTVADAFVEGVYARLIKTVNQGTANATVQTMTFQTADEVGLAGVAVATPASNSIELAAGAGAAGIYAITTTAQWISNATGNRLLAIYNGGTILDIVTVGAASGLPTRLNCACLFRHDGSVARSITAGVFQSSGGALDVTSQYSNLTVTRVAAL